MVGIALGAEAACPAPASTNTPAAIRNCRIRGGICPEAALSIKLNQEFILHDEDDGT